MTAASAPAPARPKRPASVLGGALLMIVRALSGVGVVLTVLGSWDRFADAIVITGDGFTHDPGAAGVVLGWLLALYGLYLALYIGLAVLVFSGHNWARVLAMVFASVSILVSFADYALNGAQITLRTSLVGVTIDILILLALSSTNARHYARSRAAMG